MHLVNITIFLTLLYNKIMKIGDLEGSNVVERKDLLASPVADFIENHKYLIEEMSVAEIDSTLSDTAAFCNHYNVTPAQAANCVIIETKRGETAQYVACVILATTKADVNGLVRRHLDVRKASFAPMEKAVALTGMEFGAITPIGLPSDWPILVDSRVVATDMVIIGSGIRKSKLLVSGKIFQHVPNVTILENLGIEKTV